MANESVLFLSIFFLMFFNTAKNGKLFQKNFFLFFLHPCFVMRIFSMSLLLTRIFCMITRFRFDDIKPTSSNVFLIPQGTGNRFKKIPFFISFIHASLCVFLKCIAVNSDFSRSQLQGFQSYCSLGVLLIMIL